MKLTLVILGAFALIGVVRSGYLDCNLSVSSPTCASSYPFYFTYTGLSTSTNPCKRQYQVRVYSNRHYRGFVCRFHVNEPNGYFLYSVSDNGTATGPTPNSAYMRSFKESVFTSPKNGAPSKTWWNFYRVHPYNTTSVVAYFFGEKVLNMASGGSTGVFSHGSPHLFTPVTSNRHHIGLNRRYATKAYAGAGLCRVHCYTVAAARSRSYSGIIQEFESGSIFGDHAPAEYSPEVNDILPH